MVSIYLYAAILTLNLSSTPAEGFHGPRDTLADYNVLHLTPPGRPNSHTGRSTDSNRLVKPPEGDGTFTKKHPPVPYASAWNNPLNQTAQQWVAILSILEDDGLPIDIFMDDFPK